MRYVRDRQVEEDPLPGLFPAGGTLGRPYMMLLTGLFAFFFAFFFATPHHLRSRRIKWYQQPAEGRVSRARLLDESSLSEPN
mgnify:CR=1 FL=1